MHATLELLRCRVFVKACDFAVVHLEAPSLQAHMEDILRLRKNHVIKASVRAASANRSVVDVVKMLRPWSLLHPNHI